MFIFHTIDFRGSLYSITSERVSHEMFLSFHSGCGRYHNDNSRNNIKFRTDKNQLLAFYEW